MTRSFFNIPRGPFAVLALMCAALLALGGCATRHSRPDPAYAGAPQHTVVAGETLSSISETYGIDVATIVKANRLAHKDLYPGQVLVLPGARQVITQIPQHPVAPTVPVDDGVSWFTPRAVWAVQTIDTANADPMAKIYRITVHHSSEHGDATGDPVDMLRLFEKNHKLKGWACIGYHFIIATDGRVYEGRPLAYQGAHAGGDNNIGNVGVCLLGNFERDRVPEVQRAALISVLDRLSNRFEIARTEIHGHREFKTTDCPGRYLMAVVDEYRGGSGDVGPADVPSRPAHVLKKKDEKPKHPSASTKPKK
ncbi:MAG: N-acetylmuramoyl-L-alanine amidase [Planctomycetes bacterium]|nr:N-acetylmuramoyl-L-alanine amidase [Planctomycetota bacterium]